MQLRIAAATCVLVSACGSSPDAPQVLLLERWSPPQLTSADIFLGGHDDVVVMTRRISHDGGATWRPLDPRFGDPSRVAIRGSVVSLHAAELGLVRWDLVTDTVTPVTGAPPYASERSWRIEPASGRFMVTEGVENEIAIERAAGWTTSRLPQPAATELRPYIKDIEGNGSVLLTISAWGIHRSTDGDTWQVVTSDVPDGGRDLIVLPDRRFLLLGGPTTYAFDATGAPAGTMPGITVEIGDASVCDDGTIVAREQLSRDLGMTWQPLLSSGDLKLQVQRVGCGGGRYWILVLSDTWGYRLLTTADPSLPARAAGNWELDGEPAWSTSGAPIVRTTDGTFLSAGLAWRDGEPAWSLRETPTRTWASGDTLFGVTDDGFFTSFDGGVTWTAQPADGLDTSEPEAFARDVDGSFLVSAFTSGTSSGVTSWRSTVWRSTDGGATWTVAYDATASRREGDEESTGEAHRFVGVRADGAWIATDAVSLDGGNTWQENDVKGDRSLAFLTPRGRLVTTLPEPSPEQDLWRVYEDSGLGELQATYALVADGKPVAASPLRSIAFDEHGHVYVARGAPYVQVWRSAQPID